MIVNYTRQGWELITQRAHGMLAAQLALHWRKDQRPERWMETLLAIAEHDDALVELEEEMLLTEAGGPVNFTMKNFELDHCQRLSRFTQSKSRYIALLTSLHMEFIYRKDEGSNAEARTFLQAQRKLQEQWRQELGMSKEETEKIYAFMEWSDAFSLLLCRREVQPEGRAVEISRGPNNEKYELLQVAEGSLTLNPWPFETESFRVFFESRIVGQLQFKDSDQLRQAFLAAPVQETTWELVATKPKPPEKKVKAK